MVRIKKIDHVAIAVDDVDATLAKYKQVLGLEPTVREVVASQKTEAVLLPIGETSVAKMRVFRYPLFVGSAFAAAALAVFLLFVSKGF